MLRKRLTLTPIVAVVGAMSLVSSSAASGWTTSRSTPTRTAWG